MISAIIGLILLAGGITLYRTFALYEEKKEFNVLRGRVPAFSKGNGDVELAVLIDGEVSTEFPDKNSDAIVESITCDNGATGTWDYNAWGVLVSNLKKSKTSCTISFKTDMIAKLKAIINSTSDATSVDEFLLNTDDVDKLIASTDGMNYIVENIILKDAIKNSSNYTIDVVKKFLSSTVISNDEKYNAALPCYLFKHGNSNGIYGGFTTKVYHGTDSSGTSNSTVSYGALNGYYYQYAAYSSTYVTSISNNIINTKNYHYLEMNFGYSGATTLITIGFGPDQERDNWDITKSETYKNAANYSITLDISEYQKEAYLKAQSKNVGAASSTSYIAIATIVLY